MENKEEKMVAVTLTVMKRGVVQSMRVWVADENSAEQMGRNVQAALMQKVQKWTEHLSQSDYSAIVNREDILDSGRFDYGDKEVFIWWAQGLHIVKPKAIEEPKMVMTMTRGQDKYEVDGVETREEFMDKVWTFLAEDTSGHYRHVRFNKKGVGYLDEAIAAPSLTDRVMCLPSWYVGPGWYDESDNPVLLDSETVEAIEMGDWRIKLEQQRGEGDDEQR